MQDANGVEIFLSDTRQVIVPHRDIEHGLDSRAETTSSGSGLTAGTKMGLGGQRCALGGPGL